MSIEYRPIHISGDIVGGTHITNIGMVPNTILIQYPFIITHPAYFDNASINSQAFCQILVVIVVVEEVCYEKEDITVSPTSIETSTVAINSKVLKTAIVIDWDIDTQPLLLSIGRDTDLLSVKYRPRQDT